MRPETIEHSLLLLPTSLDKIGTLADISSKPHPIFSKQKQSHTERDLNSGCDCVICMEDFASKETFEAKVLEAKKLMKVNGHILVGVMLPVGVAPDYIISFFRKHGLAVVESSIGRRIKPLMVSYVTMQQQPLEHVFLLKQETITRAVTPIIRKDLNTEPCTEKTAACKLDPNHAMPECCYNHLKEMILYLCKTFDEKNICYWIDYGTLLGAARDGNIIPWDDDGDIGILESDLPKLTKLSKEVVRLGYELNVNTVYNQSLARLYYSRVNQRYVDIYIWHDLGKFISNSGYKIDKELFTPIQEINLHGQMVKCLNNYELYLEGLYGIDWRTAYSSQGKVDDVRI
jgi:hypothetical protein